MTVLHNVNIADQLIHQVKQLPIQLSRAITCLAVVSSILSSMPFCLIAVSILVSTGWFQEKFIYGLPVRLEFQALPMSTVDTLRKRLSPQLTLLSTGWFQNQTRCRFPDIRPLSYVHDYLHIAQYWLVPGADSNESGQNYRTRSN